MQSTHKIAGKDAGGYATYLTSESERGDYYVDPQDEEGEGAAGEWHGSPSVLASLGLSSDRPVERDQLVALMNGEAPNDGRKIRPAGGNGTKVAGVDMTFSAPKDVSALWAASSGEHRDQIEKADWNEQRLENPEGRTVMLTDASNEELDRLNQMARDYREQAGELGNDRAELPGAPIRSRRAIR
jgi:hypothetical protein